MSEEDELRRIRKQLERDHDYQVYQDLKSSDYVGPSDEQQRSQNRSERKVAIVLYVVAVVVFIIGSVRSSELLIYLAWAIFAVANILFFRSLFIISYATGGFLVGGLWVVVCFLLNLITGLWAWGTLLMSTSVDDGIGPIALVFLTFGVGLVLMYATVSAMLDKG